MRVPSRESEDARQLHREMRTLKTERTAHTNRIGSLLTTQGIVGLKIDKFFLQHLKTVHTGDGPLIEKGKRERLEREFERLQIVVVQIRTLQMQQARML